MSNFSNNDVPCISTDALPVRVNFSPPLRPRTEEQVSRMLTEAGITVSRMASSPQSTINPVLKTLKQISSSMEKYMVRYQLKREVSKALEAEGISLGMVDKLALVFVNLLIEGFELGRAEPSASIILYLKCASVWSLSRLRDIFSLLLQLLNDVIEECSETPRQTQLVVKAEDHNSYMLYLGSVAGKSVKIFVILL